MPAGLSLRSWAELSWVTLALVAVDPAEVAELVGGVPSCRSPPRIPCGVMTSGGTTEMSACISRMD